MNPWIPLTVGLVVTAVVFLPKQGLWPRWRKSLALRSQLLREDLLKQLVKREAAGRKPSLEGLAGALQLGMDTVASLLQDLEDHGMVSHEEGRLRLTPKGREMALHIVRAHRLWETYLAEQTGIAESEWHQRAEEQEHLLTRQQTEALAASLGHPTHDPHGDAIPDERGDWREEDGQSLNAVPVDVPVLITHIEDEPTAVYAQLCAQGLRAGMKAFVIDKSPHRIRFWADGNEHVLAPILADNLSVVLLPDSRSEDLAEEEFLSGLRKGQTGTILGLSSACRGPERRRLLDLGFVPGTEVKVEMVSPGGDPTAYQVRGTLVALRREQSGFVRIRTEKESRV